MMDQQTLLETTVQQRVADALRIGGRARVTVTSKATGKHLTVRLACKKKGEDGRWISRARKDGRVGIDDAKAVFVDGGDAAFAGWVATLYTGSGVWYTPDSWEDSRGEHYAWAARKVITWALSGDAAFDEVAEVELAEECSVCGRGLTDPESITRGVGPECYGAATGSQHV
jgi:hypothetical protein